MFLEVYYRLKLKKSILRDIADELIPLNKQK